MGDERQDLCSLKSGPRGSPREGWGPGVREEAKKHIEGSQEARKYDWLSGRCREEGGEGDSGIPNMEPGNDVVWWQQVVQDIELIGYKDSRLCL